MAQDVYGQFLSDIGRFDLNFDYSNLALISVDSDNLPALITGYNVTRGERIQVVQTFNDFVHLYSFGKNPIQIALSGFTLANDDSINLKNLIDAYEGRYRAFQSSSGGLVEITSVRGETLKGVATNFTYTANSETPVLVNFSMSLIGLGDGDTILPGSITTGSGGGGGSANNVPSVGRS